MVEQAGALLHGAFARVVDAHVRLLPVGTRAVRVPSVVLVRGAGAGCVARGVWRGVWRVVLVLVRGGACDAG
ncbi:major facilitator superfamily MFS_1 [Streptomyces laurentii]|uniref:Major facilitator superfamily MFS_1 n=1 Tax=Streptomyces laurentii TaxID=39478 RepID=A0A160NU14_STRLU|nr:major facilitator superfamily MFS_1 [Streptomyces laurentii]